MMLDELLAAGAPGIVAILRGVRPHEVIDIGTALVMAGVRIIEVPLNSPEPLVSIKQLDAHLGRQALIGAGTVLSPEGVSAVAAAGGRLIVSPNTDRTVIERALQLDLDALPGAMTPTEAFAANAAGAIHIKIFPSSSTGPAHLRALREVLPHACRLWAVGGTGAANLKEWLAAGAAGIGVGSALYQPGDTASSVAARAEELISVWNEARLMQ